MDNLISEFKGLKEEIRTSGEYLIVGVDIGKRRNLALLMNSQGEIYRRKIRFSNNLDGFNRLLTEVEHKCVEKGLKGVVVGMEPTASYWKPLAYFFGSLRAVKEHWQVVTVRTSAVAANRKTLDTSPDKNDWKDAYNIGDLISQGKFHLCLLRDKKQATLCRLLRMYYRSTTQSSGCKARIRQILGEIFPELEIQTKDLFSVRWRKVLKAYPFARDLVRLGAEELGRLLCDYGKRREAFPEEGRRVWQMAVETVGVEVEAEAVGLELEWLWGELEECEKRAGQVRQKLLQHLEGTKGHRLLLTIPGVGPILAAGFLAEIGRISNFRNYKELISFAGLDVIGKQSANWWGERRKISKYGRKYLRTVAYQAAVRAVAQAGEFKECYQRALTQQKGKKKFRRKALVKVADKMLRVVYGVLKHGQWYQEDYRQQQEQSQAA